MTEAKTRQHHTPRLSHLCFASGTVVLALVAGCSRRAKEGETSGAAASASAAPSSPAPSTAPPTVSASAGAGVLFGSKLAQEAQGRPTGTPKAEDVLAAITAAGVPLESVAQHVATTIGAHFCIGATSKVGLRLSACEYDTEAGAAAGRDLSTKAFAPILHRDIALNKKTSLTILQQPFTPDSQVAHDKAMAAFRKM
jgi:hypothetical protein